MPSHRPARDGGAVKAVKAANDTYLFAARMENVGWWPGTESNRRRQPFQGCALPAELPGQQAWTSTPESCGSPHSSKRHWTSCTLTRAQPRGERRPTARRRRLLPACRGKESHRSWICPHHEQVPVSVHEHEIIMNRCVGRRLQQKRSRAVGIHIVGARVPLTSYHRTADADRIRYGRQLSGTVSHEPSCLRDERKQRAKPALMEAVGAVQSGKRARAGALHHRGTVDTTLVPRRHKQFIVAVYEHEIQIQQTHCDRMHAQRARTIAVYVIHPLV